MAIKSRVQLTRLQAYLSAKKEIKDSFKPYSKFQEQEEEIKDAKYFDSSTLLEKAFEELRDTKPEDFISYGYEFLDNHLGGINKGDLILIGGETGCIDKNAVVTLQKFSKRANRVLDTQTMTLEKAFLKFNRINQIQPIYKDTTYKIQCYDGENIVYNFIDEIWESGVKQLYEVETIDGYKLQATDEHPFLTADGFKRLDELKVGDEIIVKRKKQKEKKKRVRRKTVIVYYHKDLNYKKDKYQELIIARAVKEAELNNLNFNEYINILKTDKEKSKKLKTLKNKVVHHIDLDPTNDNIENLQVMTKEEHDKLHSDISVKNILREVPVKVKIKSIVKKSKGMTYDISMKEENKNFVVNGFVVHNTGKTTFANNIVLKASKKHKVAVWSLEDNPLSILKQKIYNRINELRIKDGKKRYPFIAFWKNEIDSREFYLYRKQAVEDVQKEIGKNLIYVDTQQVPTIELLEKEIEKQSKLGIKLMLIDHLHKFSFKSQSGMSKADIIEDFMNRLRKVQDKTGMRVILIVHYTKLNGAKPILDSFKDSISIPQNASVVINLWRDRGENENGVNLTKIMIPKIRIPVPEVTFDVQYDETINDYSDDIFVFGTEQGDKYKEVKEKEEQKEKQKKFNKL